jgi:C-terminal processing protease CtpA/Prc
MNLNVAPQSVGIGIRVGATQSGALHITGIPDDGPAGRSGLLNVGDVIHSVDGFGVHKMALQEVMSLILGAPGSVITLGVQRGSDSSRRLIFATMTRDHRRQVVIDDVVQRVIQRVGIVLEKTASGVLIIRQIIPGSATAGVPGLEAGDAVVSIDGKFVTFWDPSQAYRLIDGPDGTSFTLRIWRPGSARVDSVKITRRAQSISTSNLMRRRSPSSDPSCGVGISLAMTSKGQLEVSKLSEGGSAQRSGKIVEGDVLLDVDDIDVFGKPIDDVIPLITGQPGSVVELTLYRKVERSVVKVKLTRETMDATNGLRGEVM